MQGPVGYTAIKKITATHTGKRCDDAKGILTNIDFGFPLCRVMLNHILYTRRNSCQICYNPQIYLDLSAAAADMVQTVNTISSKRGMTPHGIIFGNRLRSDAGDKDEIAEENRSAISTTISTS